MQKGLIVVIILLAATMTFSTSQAVPGDGYFETIMPFPSVASDYYRDVDSVTVGGVDYIAAVNATKVKLYTRTDDTLTFANEYSGSGGTGSGKIAWNDAGEWLAHCSSNGLTIWERSGTTLTQTYQDAIACGGSGSVMDIQWDEDFLIYTNSLASCITGAEIVDGIPTGTTITTSPAQSTNNCSGNGFEFAVSNGKLAARVNANVSIFERSGTVYTWVGWGGTFNISGTAPNTEGPMNWNAGGTLLGVTTPGNSGGSGACGSGAAGHPIFSYSGSLSCIGSVPQAGASPGHDYAWHPSNDYVSWGDYLTIARLPSSPFEGLRLITPTNITNTAVRGVDWNEDGTYFYVAQQTSTPYLSAWKISDDRIMRDSTSQSVLAGNINQVRSSEDGNWTAAVHQTTPFVTIFNTSVFPRTTLSNPASLPASTGNGVAWGNNSEFLAVAHTTTPFVTIYQRSGDTFTKLSNPAALPAATGQSVDFSPSASHLAVGHSTTPFMSVYSRSGTTFTKLSNPASLPATTVTAIAWSPNGTMLAAGSNTLEFYYLSGSTLIKQTAPAVLPNGSVNSMDWHSDGTLLVGHSSAPYLSLYRWNGATFERAPDVQGGLNALSRVEVAWNPQGNAFIAVAGGIPTVNVYSWDNTTAQRMTLYEQPAATSSAVEWYKGLDAFSSRIVLSGQTTDARMIWYNTTFGTPPMAPTNVQAIPGNGNVYLSWNEVEGATSYSIYYDTESHDCSSIGSYDFLTTLTDVSYLHGGLTNGVTYYYCVGATLGATTYADEVNATPSENAGAPILSGRAWRANAELSWTTGGYLPVTSYLLYRGNSTENLTLYQTFNSTIQAYDDAQSPGDCWYYAVVSTNNTAESPFSNILEICYRPPPPPVFGDCGSVWGADRTEDGNLVNCKETLAAQVGMSTLGLSVLYGVILTLAIASAGYMAGKYVGYEWMTSLIAGIIGVAVSMIVGFFPVWLVAFVGVAGTAIILLFHRMRRDA